MYIFFDRNGTIKEVINDESIRRGSNDYNKIYCYLEGNPDIDDIWYLQKNPDGTLTNEVSFVDNIVTKSIPYDSKRDMKYFQDFEEYKFYVFTLSSSYLSQNGLVVATIRVAENNTLWALGELTFNVQANIVNSDNDITQSQYDYLLLTISSYYSKTEIDNKLDLKADKSDTYTKQEVNTLLVPKVAHDGNQLKDSEGNNMYPNLDAKTKAKIDNAYGPAYVGEDTSTNILSKTSNTGIWKATDNNHWYYWNGTQYVDGGIYQATLNLNIEFEKGSIHTDGTEVNEPPYNEIRARSNFIHLNKGDCLVFNHTFKYDYNIIEYDEEQIIQSDDGWTNIAQWIAPKNMYVRIVVRYNKNYLNLINRAVAYWHRNDLYELKSNRIIFDLKDVKSGDTLIISSNDNQRWALTIYDKPYGNYTTPNYIYDSGWINGDDTILTHTIESNAKNALIVWSMADNSNITTKGWLLNPIISVRKTNDENILDDDMFELSNDGVLINRVGSFNVIKNTKYNDIIRWGHRGMPTLAPENTMPSFEMAYKMGYRCMECDIRLTLDNIPIILHDDTINRTARNLDGSTIGTSINVSSLNLPTLLNNYDFGIFFSDQFKGTKIPTFEEFIIWAKSKNCYVHLDLLGGAFNDTTKLDILYNLVAQYGMLNNCLWEINNNSFVSYLQGKGISNDNIMYNPSDVYSTSLIDNIVSLGLKKISMKSNHPFYVINYALSKGLDVYIWGDDNISTLLKYYKYGVSGFYFNSMIVDYYLQDYNYVLSQRKDM